MLTYDDMVAMSEDFIFELRNHSKHIAVLMNGGSIDHVFVNRYACHAEELAINFYKMHHSRLKRPRIYITRVSDTNRMSRPCAHCCALLKRFPQVRVFYTESDGTWTEERLYDTTHISLRRKQMGFWRESKLICQSKMQRQANT